MANMDSKTAKREALLIFPISYKVDMIFGSPIKVSKHIGLSVLPIFTLVS